MSEALADAEIYLECTQRVQTYADADSSHSALLSLGEWRHLVSVNEN